MDDGRGITAHFSGMELDLPLRYVFFVWNKPFSRLKIVITTIATNDGRSSNREEVHFK